MITNNRTRTYDDTNTYVCVLLRGVTINGYIHGGS